MLRPPDTGGHGGSDLNDYDDVEITPKRGHPDDIPGEQPVEGQPEMQLPGADQGPGQGDDLPQELGERIENGSSSAIATGAPDILPDVETPDTTM